MGKRSRRAPRAPARVEDGLDGFSVKDVNQIVLFTNAYSLAVLVKIACVVAAVAFYSALLLDGSFS